MGDKLIRFSSQVLEDLFRAERRILAHREHAHIALLHDAGTSPEGGLYVVMEYVNGQSIDIYCRHRQLPVADIWVAQMKSPL